MPSFKIAAGGVSGAPFHSFKNSPAGSAKRALYERELAPDVENRVFNSGEKEGLEDMLTSRRPVALYTMLSGLLHLKSDLLFVHFKTNANKHGFRYREYSCQYYIPWVMQYPKYALCSAYVHS